MAKSIKEERLRWISPVLRRETRIVDMARICPYSARSLKRWLHAYRRHGEEALTPKSTKPKTNPNETPIFVKERIIELRKQTSLCARKLKWKIEKQNVNIHERTIGKILKIEGLTRKYRSKKMKYKYVRVERQLGELLEVDVKYVPGKIEGERYFQYTAIDTASRWRHLRIYEEQSSFYSVEFLKEVMERFPWRIQAVKTDNHSTFTNWCSGTNKRSDLTLKTLHALDVFCGKHGIVHYLIDPGKPAQNGMVERSHRSDQESFYDRNIFESEEDLKKKIRAWNKRYNNLEHCSLNGKTPNEMLELFKVTNVRA